jgi:hypothetical protein
MARVAGALPRVAIVAVLALVVRLAIAVALAQGTSLEAAIKATYLYKFAPYVVWPPETFAAPQSPLALCIVGDDAVGGVIERVAKGQMEGERPIVVRRSAATEPARGCQIVFVSGSDSQAVSGALAALRGAPVLTVTDSIRDPDAKGIINFVLRDNHVRFEIDDRAAAASGLTISSKLLSLAVDVRPRM